MAFRVALLSVIVLSFKCVFAFSNHYPQGELIVNEIVVSGNKRTHLDIIYRELLFKKGDAIPITKLDDLIIRSEQNLMNTSLFNFVSISSDKAGENEVIIRIRLTERWYIWPAPILFHADRNFNEFVQNRDWSRLNYGAYLSHHNFRGRSERITGQFQWGYDRYLGINYSLPYINRNKTLGLFFDVYGLWNHETVVDIVDNDNTYFKSDNGFALRKYVSRAGIQIRQNIYNTHLANFKFERIIVKDSVLIVNPDFISSSDVSFVSFEYKFKNDHRDFIPYPLKGHYLDFEFQKNGFGISSSGKEIDYFVTKTTSRKYWDFGKNIYGAIGLIAQYTNKPKGLFHYFTGLGYGRDFIRSYEYYVIESKAYALFKSNVKWNLLPQREIRIKGLNIDQFNPIPIAVYFNVFFDGAYSTPIEKGDPIPFGNKWLYGYGLGLDAVTYYDKVLRLEYSFSSFGKNGIFIHFIAPI